MTNREQIAATMPAMLRHEGVWVGEYQVVDVRGTVIDRHASRVECSFPAGGDYHYVQSNRFTWPDGRTRQVEFGGVMRGDRLFWDTDTFSGYGWATRDDIVMLVLDRKDVPNASFTEVIVLGSDPDSRARTWHWFKDGELYQRTLCNERREP